MLVAPSVSLYFQTWMRRACLPHVDFIALDIFLCDGLQLGGGNRVQELPQDREFEFRLRPCYKFSEVALRDAADGIDVC